MADKTRQQEVFIAALLTQPTTALAAKVAGISVATSTRWLGDPAFQTRFAAARREALAEAMVHLQSLILSAVRETHGLMVSTSTSATQKLHAADILLRYGFKSIELETLEDKMNRILTGLEELRSHATI